MRAAHSDLESDKDCTLACINMGSKYVLVSKGKVFQISNQNLDDLQKYAGQNVTLTGKLTGDSIEGCQHRRQITGLGASANP